MAMHAMPRYFGRPMFKSLAKGAFAVSGLVVLGYFAVAADGNSRFSHGGFSGHAAAGQVFHGNAAGARRFAKRRRRCDGRPAGRAMGRQPLYESDGQNLRADRHFLVFALRGRFASLAVLVKPRHAKMCVCCHSANPMPAQILTARLSPSALPMKFAPAWLRMWRREA